MNYYIQHSFSIFAGIVIGVSACIITFPHIEPLVHDFAHESVSKVVKPLGGSIAHPLAGTFEHEVKRTD